MDLNALSDQIEKSVVEDEFGFGQQIVVVHKSGTRETVNAFVSEGEYEKKESSDAQQSIVRFLSVFLENTLNQQAKIEYDGKTWSIKDRGFTGNNPYDIDAYVDKRTNNRNPLK